MNFNPFKLRTNSLVFITAIVVMGLFFLFYFEYYIKTNENNIIAAHFRALDQMGINIDKRLDIYLKNAEGLEKKIDNEWDSIRLEPGNRDKNTDELLLLLIDTLNEKGDFNKNLKVKEIFRTQKQIEHLHDILNPGLTEYYRFAIKIKDPPFKATTVGKTAYMVIEAPYAKLTDGLQRDDIFDGLILIRDSDIVYNTMDQQMLYFPAERKKAEKETEDKTDDRLSAIGTVVSGKVTDMPVSNIMYKAFIKPFRINNETWFAIGLVNAGKFNAATRSIDPWLIISVSVLLMFIILGLPVIKLKVLSETEQLDTRNIIDYALFTMLGGAFITIFFAFIANNFKNQQNINTKLEDLSSSIYNSFVNELNDAYRQLEFYDENYQSMSFPKNEYNSAIRKDILSEEEPYFPASYPFGDYYFWTDNKGMQTAYLTPFNFYGKLSNLSSRDYINKKDEWFMPGSKTKRFRLQSIVSVTSGTVKAAISKKGAFDDVKRAVVAVSTRMYSLINTILPMDHQFCIIDKKGMVWFHSNPDRNLKENFIEECNNSKYLKAAIYSNTTKTLDVKYFNYPYRIMIRHIDNLPLYLIVMYNKKAIKSFQAEVITFTLIFTGIVFLLIFLQIFSLLVIEKNLRKNFSRNLLIKLTIPVSRLNLKYKYLLKLHLLILPVYVIYLYFASNMAALTAILSLSIFLFTYSYFVLNKDAERSGHIKWFIGVNTVLLLIVTLAGYALSPAREFIYIIIFDILLIAITVAGHKFLLPAQKSDNKYWINYTRLLIIMLILLGILPALKFYVTGYNNESKIRVKHTLMNLRYQKETRNKKILNIYTAVKPSEKRDSIINLRNNLGIYTRFYNHTVFSDQINNTGNDPSNSAKWDSLYCFIRPFYDKYIIENKYLPLSVSKNSNISWRSDNEKIILRYNSLTEFRNHRVVKPYYISSTVPRINIIVPFDTDKGPKAKDILFTVIFWIFISAAIFMFYHLLKFGLFRIFSYNIIKNYEYPEFDKKLDNLLTAYDRILLISQSSLEEPEKLLDHFSEEKGRLILDWSKTEKTAKSDKEIAKFRKNISDKDTKTAILITGIDHELEKTEETDQKIEALKRLTERKDVKIVVLLQESPENITGYYQKQIEKINELKISNDEKSKELKELYELNEKVNSVLKNFHNQFVPVRFSHTEGPEEGSTQVSPVDILINNELNAADHLMKFRPAFETLKTECEELLKSQNSKSTSKQDKEKERIVLRCHEQIINKTHDLAGEYYEEIFSACSAEEKYILLDLAHDLIINPKNGSTIYALLDKSLLVKRHDRITIMNKSFHKFLISKLHLTKELEKQLTEKHDSGTWQGYKVTLIVIILSLFAFITLANQEFLDNLNKLFVGIGGAIAAITAIIKLLSYKKGPASKG